jgi:IrrE N-terminal-like domain
MKDLKKPLFLLPINEPKPSEPINQPVNQPDLYLSLLHQLIDSPQIANQAYRLFHNYSFGNTLLSIHQQLALNLPIGPIATMKQWNQLGYTINKGSRAIGLYMPITIKVKTDGKHATNTIDSQPNDQTENKVFSKFLYKRHWFALAQTNAPQSTELPQPKKYDTKQALTNLNITLTNFQEHNGNIMGYATTNNQIAINPLNPNKEKTLFHEIAHIVLKHTQTDNFISKHNNENIPRSQQEVEAETTAYITLAAIDPINPSLQYSSSYIRSFIDLQKDINPYKQKTLNKIFHAVDTILKAGQVKESTK